MQDGDRFWRIAETYVRGNTIKYIRVPDEVSRRRGVDRGGCIVLCMQVIDKVQDEVYVQRPQEGHPARAFLP